MKRAPGSPSSGPLAAVLRLVERLAGPDAAVFATDARQHVVHWSPGAERLLGWSAEEALGEHCLKTNRCLTCLAGCGVREHGEIEDALLEVRTASGEAIRVRKQGVAVRDADGSFAGTVEVLHPVEPARPSMPPGAVRFHGLLTRDPAMVRAFELVRSVARTNVTVLVRGESGTGKELVARAIHAESDRAQGPWLAVNCGAIAPSLLESTLFGHVRGAFTGATSDRPGLFRQAHGGTLFLDEVGEMPLDLQARLLRVLQDREVIPVGGSRPIKVDVRVIGATHRSLRQMVEAGRFRRDLMYRLRVVPIFLPPLRERPADIDLLLHHFLDELARRGGRRILQVDPEAMRRLRAHPWPGNVRELVNVLEYASVVGRGPVLRPEDLPPEFTEGAAPPLAPEADLETRVREALRRAGGRPGRAAELLGVSRATFWRWRKKVGL